MLIRSWEAVSVELELSRSALRRLTRLPSLAEVARLAGSLYRPRRNGRLLVVGTEDYEPWHLVAHLGQRQDRTMPIWVRHAVPERAPAHLAAGLDTLSGVSRTDTVLIVAPDQVGDELLERLSDARSDGGTVLSLTGQATESSQLCQLSHDMARVATGQLDYAQHLLSVLEQ